ncbi:putative ABC transporter C family member 3-like [Cocos nucifera]|nr:putative ABC transporter C family member 3-like [Cocos nucifera]
MKDGKIIQAGKYDEILNLGTEFMELVGSHKDALALLDSMDVAVNALNSTVEVGFCDTGSSAQASHKVEQEDAQNDISDNVCRQEGQLVQEEEREKGRVGFRVYWRYITMAYKGAFYWRYIIMAYKGAFLPLILLAEILFQILHIGSNYSMAWAAPVSEGEEPPVEGAILIYVYGAFALGSSICSAISSSLLVTSGYKTSALLFNKTFMSIFRAPMSFFDSTPSGRILSRASTDQSKVDVAIPFQIGGFASSIIQLLGIIAVISQQYYISTARVLARLDGVCGAPIIQHFAESISGSMTIRSYGQEPRFVSTSFHLMNDYSRPKFHNAGAMEWLGIHLDMLSSLTFAFSLVFLISVPKGIIDPGMAGLAVTYGLSLNVLQDMVIWCLCSLENKIISVERILQYMDIPITENDENWSMGQHQLVCLGRALLRKSKILVLDEATASMDTATDGLIQKTLRHNFSESTLIAIAHRITSVLDSRMVLVLDNGIIVEHDTPSRLLDNKSSYFAKLVSKQASADKPSNCGIED